MLRFSNSCVKTQTIMRPKTWTCRRWATFGAGKASSVCHSLPPPCPETSSWPFWLTCTWVTQLKVKKMMRKKGTEDHDHLHRVRPLMEMIQLNCKAIYQDSTLQLMWGWLGPRPGSVSNSTWRPSQQSGGWSSLCLLDQMATPPTSSSILASPRRHQERGSLLMLLRDWSIKGTWGLGILST